MLVVEGVPTAFWGVELFENFKVDMLVFFLHCGGNFLRGGPKIMKNPAIDTISNLLQRFVGITYSAFLYKKTKI